MSKNPATTAAPTAVVVMGVSGSGKSTIARHLADALGYAFLDGDDLHPQANIARMRSGTPLRDADRLPWLDAIAAWMHKQLAAGHSAVVACSALKRAYRERLREAGPAVRFVYLQVDHDELARRMRAREHFMPLRLLGSQLATLEEPAGDEPALCVDANGTIEATVARALEGLAQQRPPR
ncbi:gluconokinase [Frateuria soli]|uniref:gluconokinase n=1 Tax=Frateuria soli TaxID=1542730 RepID=UPI001E2CE224|nr:gluconokinase [Frateuria soli]UGB38117.1 gluconokinase [Frateuria soli]